MKDYLILLPKSSFIDLFKYGYLYTDSNRWIQFDGIINNLSHNDEVRDKVFERANAFDYTFTYLILHFKSNSSLDGRINIESVQNLFPLDNDGKREIELSFDPRIRINAPIWSPAFHDLQIRFLYEDALKGASNIWKILKIESSITEVQDIISKEDLKEIVREVFWDIRPEGELSFWIYLMRYERHGFFPKTTKGYFYDLINVFINTFKYKELPAEAIESTNIYKFLDKLPNEIYLKDLLDAIDSSEDTGRCFINKVNEIAGLKVNGAIVSILFLVLKNKFAKGFSIDEVSQKFIDHSIINYPQEAHYALFLLGLYLGNSHTFECLYDKLPLPIFKSLSAENIYQIRQEEVEDSNTTLPLPFSIENEIITHQTSPSMEGRVELGEEDSVTCHEKYAEPSLFPKYGANNEPLHFPITMRKKEDIDAGVTSGPGYKRAKNQTQYNKYLKDGYVPVRK